ncbi:phosphopantetheine-binding protein, partial [Roseivivax sp. CAU 1761]
RRRADGGLDFLGRADGQVKLRGHRIELGEIEAVLERLPGVTRAAVLLREDRPGDPRLVAYVSGGDLPEAERRAELAARLPAIMVPQRILRLEEMPLTPNGKLDRRALPAPAEEVAAGVEAGAAADPAPLPARPGTGGAADAAALREVASRIGAIWARILGIPVPGARDNFFDLGGHSLLAIEAHRAIRSELAVPDLAIADIFGAPVLERLAARVAGLRADGAAPAAEAATGPGAEPPDRAAARR